MPRYLYQHTGGKDLYVVLDLPENHGRPLQTGTCDRRDKEFVHQYFDLVGPTEYLPTARGVAQPLMALKVPKAKQAADET